MYVQGGGAELPELARSFLYVARVRAQRQKCEKNLGEENYHKSTKRTSNFVFFWKSLVRTVGPLSDHGLAARLAGLLMLSSYQYYQVVL